LVVGGGGGWVELGGGFGGLDAGVLLVVIVVSGCPITCQARRRNRPGTRANLPRRATSPSSGAWAPPLGRPTILRKTVGNPKSMFKS